MGSSAAGVPSITPVQQMLASGSGAILTSLLVTPLDVVKTRLQAQLKPVPKSPCYLFCNGLMDHLCLCANPGSPFRPFPSAPHPPFNSTIEALIKIPQYEGPAALWRGLPPTLVMAVPNTMIYFTLYDQLKVAYGFVEGEKNHWSPMLAGTTARTASITVISPLELIRTKMQAHKNYNYKDLVGVVRSAIHQGGVLSMWQGLGPTLLRDVPFSAFYWFNYEFMKSKFSEQNFLTSFIAGATSGTIAAVATMPFDVIKTHRQMELGEVVFSDARAVKKLPFTFSLIFKLRNERGWRSLYAGVAARVMRVAPACAIMIATYEYGKTFFRHHNMDKLSMAPATVQT